jgi:putative phosphoribosyl transferase
MGVVASDGTLVLDERTMRALGITERNVRQVAAAAALAVRRRNPARILVAVRRRNPARILVAVPVAAAETCDQFRDDVDEIVCAVTPRPFHAVGLWYEDFSQTSDAQVRELLARASEQAGTAR